MRVRRRQGVPSHPGGASPRGPVPLEGYRLGAPLGFGARGAVWSAITPDGRRCAVTYLDLPPSEAGAAQRRRLRRLTTARHPGTADVVAVVDVPTGCAVVSERVDGPTLAALRAARGPLPLGEVAFVVRALGAALAHLHAHGVVHGDVSPANVILTSGDRPVLVDLVGEVALERGTDPFVPPERRRGAPAGWAGDVWSLAATVSWLVSPADRARVEAVLAPALAAEPGRRCSAEELGVLAVGLGEPSAVDLPDASVLAHGSLRASAAFDRTTATRRARLRRRGARGRRVRTAPPGGAGRARGARWTRRGAALLVGIAGGVGLGVLLVDPPPAASGPDASIAEQVMTLVGRRDAALAAADAGALAALTVPGSPAAGYDEELLRDLGRTGVRVSGLRTVVDEIEVLRADGARASVALVAGQEEHERTSVGSGAAETVAAQPPRCTVLELRADDGRWRVWDVAECERGDASVSAPATARRP